MKFTCTISLLGCLLFSSAALATPDFGPVNMGAFYAALPAVNAHDPLGKLVKAEAIPAGVPGAKAWKIAYVSSDVMGRKTLVTGIAVAPDAPAGNRPVMAWAHGTTGTAQTCGPSQVLNPAQPLNQYFLMNGNSWTDFGIPALDTFIKAGYAMVATDYQGLGGGGKHQYTVSVTQAQDVINSIRALTQLKEAGAGNRAILYGWSQGGGAVITAAGLSDYLHANDNVNQQIELIGFVAMAPYDIGVNLPADIQTNEDAKAFIKKLDESFSANIFNFTHFTQNLWGMTAAFPELHLSDVLTPEGAKVINDIMLRKCMHVASDTLNFAYGQSYAKLVRTDISNALAWINAYRKSSVAPVKPMAPVVIYYGNHDTTVPPVMGKLYYEQMCKLGGNLSRVQLPGDQSHFSTPASAQPFYVKWIAERFAGKTAQNGC